MLYRSAQGRVKLNRLFLLLKRRPKAVKTCGVHEAIINYYCYLYKYGNYSGTHPGSFAYKYIISPGIHFLVIIYPRLCHSYKNFYTLCIIFVYWPPFTCLLASLVNIGYFFPWMYYCLFFAYKPFLQTKFILMVIFPDQHVIRLHYNSIYL